MNDHDRWVAKMTYYAVAAIVGMQIGSLLSKLFGGG